MYWGDIIIANHGSGLAMNTFARPGSVVIDILPYKFRNPDLKSISYNAGLRYLEFVNMNDSITGNLVAPKGMWKIDSKCDTMNVMEVKKANWWDCFHWFQDHHHIWNTTNFLIYLEEALHRWNRPFEHDICEIPGPVPEHPYWISETEGNWMVCEAPGAVYCNKHPDCALSPDGTRTMVTKEGQFQSVDSLITQRDYNKL
jgi:hypothetical protein